MEIADLTVFVGRNGSGKSSTLHALNVFYNVRASVSEHDFFNGNMTIPVEITVEFGDLNLEEQEEFASYINDGNLIVTKKVSLENGKLEQRYFAVRSQIPAIADIRRAKTITDKRKQWNQLVDDNKLPDIGPKSERGDDPDTHLDAYEQKHLELMDLIPEEVQFFGASNIGGGKLDKYTKFVYIPAVRDASDDSADKKGSLLFQLMDLIVMRRFRARKDVRALQSEFSDRLKTLYEPDKLIEFEELATGISQTLQVYVPNAKLALRVTEPTLPEIPNPATIAELIEDEYSGSIDRKGHGLQRALIFSLLQHLAVAQPIEPDEESQNIEDGEVKLEEADSSEVIDNTQAAPQTVGPDLIIAIEEPELYQHPLRARHLSNILLSMSQESTMGPGGRNQILYTTHSPYLVDLQRFDQLRIMRKYKQEPGEPPCTTVASYSLHSAAEKLAELTGKPREQFSADSFRARAYSVMTQSVNEGFFADAVVLVEGDTDVAALLVVANRLGNDWISKGIAIVPVGGKSKIDRAAVVFMGLQIPTYIIFDADNKHKGKKDKEDKTIALNRLLLRVCEAAEDDFPSAIASTKHACFEDDFETYCTKTIGEADYERLRETAAHAHGYDRPSEGIKNFDVVVDLVNAIYDTGHKLELVEQIVNSVNQMLAHESATPTAEEVVETAQMAQMA